VVRATFRSSVLPMAAFMAAGTGGMTWTSATMGSVGTTTENVAMRTDAGNTTLVQGQGARLEVRFDYPASRPLNVAYRFHNDGAVPLMVFDRGNRHAVMTRKQALGDVGAPVFSDQGGDVTLSHRALPLPRPTPILPPTPLAARVEPGATMTGEFEFSVPTAQAPRRLRWCLGVAPFAEDFREYKLEPRTREVWLASFAVVDRQQLLCTPWYDVAKAAFEPA
jgi:hypothetical protein